MQGEVKKWFEEKGFGFIKPDDGSKDVFVHQSNVKMEGFRKLAEGQMVEFDLVPSKKGGGKMEAVEVRPLS